MADRYPWWKSFTGRKKNNVLKESVVQQNSETAAEKPSHDTEDKNSSPFLHGDMYDDSHIEPAFNEHASRRSLWVSRSGRFKEKRRARVTLPENNFYETNTAVAK